MSENLTNKQSDKPESDETQKSVENPSESESEQEPQAEEEQDLFDDRSPKIQDRDL